MVLVDEYDRAPMNALRAGEDLDKTAFDAAREPLKIFLSALKAIGNRGHRFFVTGIAPLAVDGDSIFNSAAHLTFDAAFADTLGLTEAEVASLLVTVARIEDDAELGKAMTVARELYSGHMFFCSDTKLYNPQLVLQFAERYRTNRLKQHLDPFLDANHVDIRLLDRNQWLSDADFRLITANLALRKMIFDLNSGAVDGQIKDQLSANDLAVEPSSYFWYGGRLTLSEPRDSTGGISPLVLPNLATKASFVMKFLEATHTLTLSNNFCDNPTEELLRAICEQMLKDHDAMDKSNTEADLEMRLSFAFRQYGNGTALHQAPAEPSDSSGPSKPGRRPSTDLAFRFDKHYVIVELKFVKKECLLPKAVTDATEQVQGYGKLRVKHLRAGVELRLFTVIHCPEAKDRDQWLVVKQVPQESEEAE
eukprot:TRINITY_DN6782_c0_g1_i1.p1 TRINITY_DN6782_c0_g1~~TRINITY_DN6782_c0_g1_i1.p1  ORF type:complete len:421 (+),score=65.07 TRINITY_DN6782_c0_g1_i1:885-2147(+)